MRKIIFFYSILLLLTACAGEPPKWWNPSDKYTAPKANAVQSPAQEAVKTVPAVKKDEEIKEEDIMPVGDETLEEVDFQPLEDNPAAEEEDLQLQQEIAAPQTAQPPLAPSILDEATEETLSEEENNDAEDESL